MPRRCPGCNERVARLRTYLAPEAVVDQQRKERFKEAVERKARASEAPSRSTNHGPPGSEGGGVQGDQESLRDPSQPQDTFSPREKNMRHRKVTADKWISERHAV